MKCAIGCAPSCVTDKAGPVPLLIILTALEISTKVSSLVIVPKVERFPVIVTLPSNVLLPNKSNAIKGLLLFTPTLPCKIFLPNDVDSGVFKLYDSIPITEPLAEIALTGDTTSNPIFLP